MSFAEAEQYLSPWAGCFVVVVDDHITGIFPDLDFANFIAAQTVGEKTVSVREIRGCT